MPSVSVVFATYNYGHYILAAINSVLAQTYKDYEIIVVDDGSTDDTRGILEQFSELLNFRYVYQTNQGQSVARNQGVKLAAGKYISFHDADDISNPTKLKKQAAYLDMHPEVGLVHSGYSKFDEDGNDLGYRNTSKFNGWIYPDILLEWSVLIGMSSVMVPADVFDVVGGFDPLMLRAQDLDMYRRIAKKYPFGVINEPLSKYRVHRANENVELVERATPYFEMYLKKAFEDDPSLNKQFQKLAFARLYTNIAQNYLARGNKNWMRFVRAYCNKSIQLDPFQLKIYLIWMASLFGVGTRQRLLNDWRKFRYWR